MMSSNSGAFTICEMMGYGILEGLMVFLELVRKKKESGTYINVPSFRERIHGFYQLLR